MKAIILLFDSLNKNYLPPYGDLLTKAPNFQRLAAHAATFDNSYVGSMPCMPARRELHTGRYNFLHREWGPLEPFDDSMPELLKKAGIYTHLISDHLHYWEDGGGNYHNRYSSWDVVRGQEGDHWKASVGEPPIPEVLRVPQNKPEAAFPGYGVMTGRTANTSSRKPIFPRRKFLTQGAILSIKIMPKITGYCRLRRSIRMSRFIPPRNIYRSMTMSGKARIMTGRAAKSVKVRRR